MSHVDHPRVVKDRIHKRVELPDNRIKDILEVDTDMPIDPQHPEYDSDEFEALAEAVSTAIEETGADGGSIRSI